MTEQHQESTQLHRSDPWEQLPDEPDRDYARFLTYLGLRDRRQSKAAPVLSVSEDLLKRVRARWRWVERAEAYDQTQAEEILASTARLRVEAAATVLEGILGAAQALVDLPDEDRDVRGLQSLAAAIRSLTPVTEINVATHGPTTPRADVVEVAFRRAQQMRSGAA